MRAPLTEMVDIPFGLGKAKGTVDPLGVMWVAVENLKARCRMEESRGMVMRSNTKRR